MLSVDIMIRFRSKFGETLHFVKQHKLKVESICRLRKHNSVILLLMLLSIIYTFTVCRLLVSGFYCRIITSKRQIII